MTVTNQRSMLFCAALFCALLSTVGAWNVVDLFVNGQHYDITYPCYRQPALISASVDGSVLLAFAEGRNLSFSQCAPPVRPDDNEIGGLVLRRSLDAGATWSSPKTIYSGNIDFYTLVWDKATSTLWLMLQRLNSVLIFSSRNQGATWSAPVPLAAVPVKPYRVLSPAVGHGIQLRPDLCTVRTSQGFISLRLMFFDDSLLLLLFFLSYVRSPAEPGRE
jgi:hypothetical protein